MEHKKWLATVTNDSINTVARKIGVKQRTLAAQLDDNRVPAENLIAIAITYGVHPVGALIETGYLDREWGASIDPVQALRSVTDEQLADEVLRRMKLPGSHEPLVTPVDELRRPHTVSSYDPDTEGFDPGRMAAWHGETELPPDDQFDA